MQKQFILATYMCGQIWFGPVSGLNKSNWNISATFLQIALLNNLHILQIFMI